MNLLKTYLPKIVISALTVCLLCNILQAQQTIQEQFSSYQAKVLQEKIYAHTDRNFYLAGDILWFKLYTIDATLHQPINVSKVAYIEILDANNNPAAQAKISLQDGKGNGSIFLPVTIPSGHYKIRAYTNWMKNFSADYYFEKTITVVNTQKQREIAPKETPSSPAIQFFPEGGNMVVGINSKIACKVNASDGKGLTYRGSIVDEKNQVVVRFQSGEFGMSHFYFTPESGHTYQAMMVVDKKTYPIPLPQIYNEGYVMRLVDSTKNSIAVFVTSNIAEGKEILLFAHTRQSIKASLKATIQNGQVVFIVDKKILGDGITHFTVFGATKQAVCERLYFKYPENKLHIQLSGNNNQYSTRSKIGFSIHSADQYGRQVSADLSMAVYKIDALQGVDEIDINTYLWLSSELKGYIESPSYYFENTTARVIQAMDNLMLTQGWRRFKWSDVQTNQIPSFQYAPEYKGPIITGKVINSQTLLPISNTETYLSAPGSATSFMTCMSDSAGKLWYEVRGMKGTTEIIVQVGTAADSAARIEIANPYAENYSTIRMPDFWLSTSTENALLEQHVATQVQNFYSGNNIKQFVANMDTSAFYEKADMVYYLDDFTRFSTMEEVLREYVTYTDVRKRKGSFEIPMLDLSRHVFFETNPLILVDGVPVFDVDKLVAFDPLKMKKLEMVHRRYILGDSYFTGIMNWRTYKGNLAGYELSPSAMVIDYEGLQLQREFYSPTYDTPEKVAAHLPDFRNVLYWTPEIQTKTKGNSLLEFYSSDKKGKYVAIIQGMGLEGEIGSKLIEFEVK